MLTGHGTMVFCIYFAGFCIFFLLFLHLNGSSKADKDLVVIFFCLFSTALVNTHRMNECGGGKSSSFGQESGLGCVEWVARDELERLPKVKTWKALKASQTRKSGLASHRGPLGAMEDC